MALGISVVLDLGVPSDIYPGVTVKITLWVPSYVSLGITGAVASVCYGVVYRWSSVSIPGKVVF